MARRSRKNDSLLDDLFSLLVMVPWWVGPLLAMLFYCVLQWMVPAWFGSPDTDDPMNQVVTNFVGKFSPTIAPVVGVLVFRVGSCRIAEVAGSAKAGYADGD